MGWFSRLFRKKEEVQELLPPVEDYELVTLLSSYSVDRQDLELVKLESVAEIVANYSEGLIKDVNLLGEVKEESELAFVFTKVKKLGENALELNNLIENLIQYYHDPILEVLHKVQEQKDVGKFIDSLGNQKKIFEELAATLNSFIVYYGILNPEQRGVADIKKEFNSKKFRKDFLDLLVSVKEDVHRHIIFPDLKNTLNIDFLDSVADEVFD
jgi:hypothetical protein